MSAIGEARAFAKQARHISEQLRRKDISPEKREELERDLEWYEQESRFCWRHAAYEAKREAMEDSEL